MKPAQFMMTPNANNMEEILMRKEYKAIYLSQIYNIIIEKTNYNINIRSTYYQLKLNKEQMSSLTNTIFNTIDETFDFIINIFNQNKYYIKGIKSNSLILRIQIYDMINGNQKEIELYLNENFEDKNYLIKELFNKYIRIEKDIIDIKNENNNLKIENNKLNQDNINLKMEIESIKNNQINGINMQINNINNMIYQIQQHFNNIQNQFDSLSTNMNQLQSQNNNNITVVFRLNGPWEDQVPKVDYIQCNPKDDIKELFEKWRKKNNIYDDNIKFIYNAKSLSYSYENLIPTIEEFGITNNANIFVIKTSTLDSSFEIIFRISKDHFYFVYSYREQKISELIKKFLDTSGFNPSDIKNFVYNNKNINQNLTVEEAGLKNGSEIIVSLKNNSNKYINIIFENGNERRVIKCLKNEKFSSVYERFKGITSTQNKYIRFSFNFIEIDELDIFMWNIIQKKTLEELGLKDNSVIYYSKYHKYHRYNYGCSILNLINKIY